MARPRESLQKRAWNAQIRQDRQREADLSAELATLKAKEHECGVCGVPAFCMVEVGRSGYAVPRCKDHRDKPAYQAEARLHSLLSLTPQVVVGSEGGR